MKPKWACFILLNKFSPRVGGGLHAFHWEPTVSLPLVLFSYILKLLPLRKYDLSQRSPWQKSKEMSCPISPLSKTPLLVCLTAWSIELFPPQSHPLWLSWPSKSGKSCKAWPCLHTQATCSWIDHRCNLHHVTTWEKGNNMSQCKLDLRSMLFRWDVTQWPWIRNMPSLSMRGP